MPRIVGAAVAALVVCGLALSVPADLHTVAPLTGGDPPPALRSVTGPSSLGLVSMERDRLESIVENMSLEQRIGQLFMVHFEGRTVSNELASLISDYHVGSVVLFSSTGNIDTPAQVRELVTAAQSLASTSGAGLPLLVAVDQEGGSVNRLQAGFTEFPSAMAVGATRSNDRAYDAARFTAKELRAVGINMNLAPVVDINSNPLNPVIGTRSLGLVPEYVADASAASIRGYQDHDVLATAKHFPGHGGASQDSHLELPTLPLGLSRLRAFELVPFRAAIREGVAAIMTAHVRVPEVDSLAPASLSQAFVTDLLRDELGFDGLVVSDSMGMGAIRSRYGLVESVVMAFDAGTDVIAFGADPGSSASQQVEAIEGLSEHIQANPELEVRLNASVLRVLAAKQAFGVLDWDGSAVEFVASEVGSDNAAAEAMSIAREAITIVRDATHIIQGLKEETDASVAVFAPASAPGLVSAVRQYRSDAPGHVYSDNPQRAEIDRMYAMAAAADVVLVGTRRAGLHPGQAELVSALQDRPVVAIALDTPYDLMTYPTARAYVAAYGSDPFTLQAVAEAILEPGVEASGCLPVHIPGLYPAGAGTSAACVQPLGIVLR